jgi:hypothetical protein
MQGLELLSVTTIFFVTYLYLPLALFRFGAEQHTDLRRSPDSTPVETFIDAAIPSAALHGATWLLMWIVGRLPLLRSTGGPPSVDWRLIAAVVTGGDDAYLRAAITTVPVPTILYFVSLVAVSGILGIMFGVVVVERLSDTALASRAPKRPTSDWWTRGGLWRALTIGAYVWFAVRLLWFAIIEIIYAAVWRISNYLLPEQSVWLFRWSVRQPTVFVRTRGNRLYFGKFNSYEKTRGGKVESVLITNVWRYCYDNVEATIADGGMPLSHFGGSLTILWDEVADIHEADESHFGKLFSRLLTDREIYLDRTLLERFAGETITAVEVFRGRAGGDRYTRDDIDASLERLSSRGILLTPAVDDGGTQYAFPNRKSGIVGATREEIAPNDKVSSAYSAYKRTIRFAVRRESRHEPIRAGSTGAVATGIVARPRTEPASRKSDIVVEPGKREDDVAGDL